MSQVAAAAEAVVEPSTPNAWTGEDRSRERYRRVALATLTSGAAKALGLLNTLLTIPLITPRLGPERFGLFFTMSTVPVLLSFTDFGLGNGLLTALAAAHGQGDETRARRLVSTAWWTLVGIALAFLALFAALYSWIPWPRVFNVHSPAAVAEAAPAVAVFVAITLVMIPLSLAQRVQQAYQEGFAAGAWLCLGNLLSLGGILLWLQLSNSLPWLVLAVAGGPALALLCSGIVEFGWRRRAIAPRWGLWDRVEARALGSTGLLMFVCQAGAAALLTAPAFLLAQTAGASAVAGFGVVQRICSVFVIASALLMTPLWPAYGEAYARGDHAWVRRTFRRSLAIHFAITALPLSLLVWFLPILAQRLSGRAVAVDLALVLATAGLAVLASTRHAVSMLVNGCGFLRRTALGFLLASAAVAIYFVLPGRPWPAGLAIAAMAGAEAIVLALLLADARAVLRSTSCASS